MPTFKVYPNGSQKPKRPTQKAPEWRVVRLLRDNPRLLGHPSESKPRDIVWFWRSKNGPGDLWGMDNRGRPVIVEVKKRLGKEDENRAASQLRAAARHGRRMQLNDLEAMFAKVGQSAVHG